MKESYRKGLANHPDPESCGSLRKDSSEALTGESAGELLSRETRHSEMSTLLSVAEDKISNGVIASHWEISRGRRTSACTEALYAGTGRSRDWPRSDGKGE